MKVFVLVREPKGWDRPEPQEFLGVFGSKQEANKEKQKYNNQKELKVIAVDIKPN